MGSLSDGFCPLGNEQELWHPLRASLALHPHPSCSQLQAGFACSFKCTCSDEKKEQQNTEGVAKEASIACPPHGHVVTSPLSVMPGYLPYTQPTLAKGMEETVTPNVSSKCLKKNAGSALPC